MDKLDTGTDELLVRIDGTVVTLSMNRPERRNTLSPAMFEGFGKVLPSIAARSDLRVLMVTGEGGSFCAGGDVKEFNESFARGDARPLDETIASIQRLQAGLSLNPPS